jgi:DNA-binding NarL/FixJ family response regulator
MSAKSMKSQKISILIADDHSLMRMGLKAMLNIQGDMTVVGEASNGREAVRLAAELAPDVIIMDLMMPELDGAEAAQQILSAKNDAKIVILTSFNNSAALLRAIQHGVCGVQMKEDNEERLVDIVRRVVNGENCIPKNLLSLAKSHIEPVELTRKQSDILHSVSRGLTNKDIARLFGITETGVQKHLKLIFAKIGAANRSEAIAIALKKQLLKL